MATKINGALQIQTGTITRALHNTTITGSAVITKIIAGTNINISSTGIDAGTGDVTVSASTPLSRNTVADLNYSVIASGITSQIVAYTSLTATRTVTLPSVASYPTARILIVDETGNASPTISINIVPNSGSDFINGAASVSVTAPYGYVELESNGSHSWTISDKWTGSLAQQNANAVAITGGTLTGVAITAISQNTGQLAGFRNKIVNGNHAIDQRFEGTSSTNAVGFSYIMDRWYIGGSAVSLFTAQRSTSTVIPSPYFALLTSSAATAIASTTYALKAQRIEGINTADLLWGTASAKTITVGFWFYASIAGTYSVSLINGAGTYSYVTTFVATTTFAYYSVTIPGCTVGVWANTPGTVGLNLVFSLGCGSSFQAPSANTWLNASYYTVASALSMIGTSGATVGIGCVQVEIGPIGTPFEQRPYALEYNTCQRFCEKSFPIGLNPGNASTSGSAFIYQSGLTTTAANFAGRSVEFKATKMASPTVTIYSTTSGASGKMRDMITSADVAGTITQLGSTGFSAYSTQSVAGTVIEMSFNWFATSEL